MLSKGGDKINKGNISKRLITLRGRKTQEEVAKALNISVSALSMYECENRIPRDEIKIKIAEYYGKTVGEIFFAD